MAYVSTSGSNKSGFRLPSHPLLLCTLLAGCAGSALDPDAVGQGQYLQINSEDKVVIEVDTSNAGMLDCPHQAYLWIRQTPSLKGKVHCSFLKTKDPLPYSFLTHRRLNESDGFKPSSPYLTRLASAQTCSSMRNSAAKMEKTFIVEDNCGAPNGSTSSPPARTTQPTQASNAPLQPASGERRAIAFRWANDPALMAGYVLLNQSGRSGTVSAKLPSGEGDCSGMFEAGSDGTGQWALSCTNGLTAVGTFKALGLGKGSVGTGVDNRGQKVEFTLAGGQ